jgi:hypothetical protein
MVNGAAATTIEALRRIFTAQLLLANQLLSIGGSDPLLHVRGEQRRDRCQHV